MQNVGEGKVLPSFALPSDYDDYDDVTLANKALKRFDIHAQRKEIDEKDLEKFLQN
jgi:hypothetical protein